MARMWAWCDKWSSRTVNQLLVAILGFRFLPACAGNGRRVRARPRARLVHSRVWCVPSVPFLATEMSRVGRGRGCGPDRPATAPSDKVCSFQLPQVRRFQLPLTNGGEPGSTGIVLSVYPRVCGERWSLPPSQRLPSGSSPCVRGTARRDRSPQDVHRFIPACAGNGIVLVASLLLSPVHPRVCGERSPASSHASSRTGSSPRVRGTVGAVRRGREGARFIPACAGNGVRRRRGPGARPVHPRVCGERTVTSSDSMENVGSSPRVRGTAASRTGPSPQTRFIPACAGNGRGHSRHSQGPSVHPRVCGERSSIAPPASWYAGSSPRVRGTARSPDAHPRASRFIPACAGNGGREAVVPRELAVHPRVCGERIFSPLAISVAVGSSPRVRGTGATLRSPLPFGRFIPACAGNGGAPPRR